MVKPITKEHISFCEAIAKGRSNHEAYVTCCKKKTTPGNARTQGYRMAKKYAPFISQLRKKASKALEVANDSKFVKEALNKILTQAQVDAKLCEIIETAKSKSDQLKAIDLYNKRFGSNEAIKQKLEVENKTYNIRRTVITKDGKS